MAYRLATDVSPFDCEFSKQTKPIAVIWGRIVATKIYESCLDLLLKMANNRSHNWETRCSIARILPDHAPTRPISLPASAAKNPALDLLPAWPAPASRRSSSLLHPRSRHQPTSPPATTGSLWRQESAQTPRGPDLPQKLAPLALAGAKRGPLPSRLTRKRTNSLRSAGAVGPRSTTVCPAGQMKSFP